MANPRNHSPYLRSVRQFSDAPDSVESETTQSQTLPVVPSNRAANLSNLDHAFARAAKLLERGVGRARERYAPLAAHQCCAFSPIARQCPSSTPDLPRSKT